MTGPGGPWAVELIETDAAYRPDSPSVLSCIDGLHAALIEAAPDAVLVIEAGAAHFALVNAAAERLLGYSREELRRMSPADLMDPRELSRLPDLRHAIAELSVWRGELFVRRKDGTSVPVEVTTIRHEIGGRVLYQGLFRDITERKRAEHDLERVNDELAGALGQAQEAVAAAEEASRAKSEFLAMMSHEIRSPLNGVIGMTGLVLDTQLDPEQREYAATIRGSGESLLQIINDILDFSKIEAERIELEVAPCDPRAIVEEVVSLLAAQAGAKGIELATLVTIPDSTRLLGDAGRIRQVLLNLVGNALKFTEAGSVTIEACLDADADGGDGALVRFDVRGTGIGISRAAAARLFQPFVQADGSTTRRYGGTGLGLAICKRLTTLLGGEIGVESEVGRGSGFWFTVRLTHDIRAEDALAMPRSIRGRHACLVSDSYASRQVLRQQLESWGVAVSTVTSAADAGST